MNPFPGPQSVIILDNCNIHKSAVLQADLESMGILCCSAPETKFDL